MGPCRHCRRRRRRRCEPVQQGSAGRGREGSRISAASLSNRERHLVALWRAYVDHPAARQADKWLAQYFREHKSYGKKDRAWYAEYFFALLRCAVAALPPEKTADANSAWRALPALTLDTPSLARVIQPRDELHRETALHPGQTLIDASAIHSAGLPQTWQRWLAHSSLNAEQLPQFLANLSTRPPLYLRVNHAQHEADIVAELKASGFAVEVLRHDTGMVSLRLVGERPIYELSCLKQGWVEIQDLASQMIGEAVDAHPGMAVWDVCAGGGGKTMQIASQMKNRGVIYASDIRDYKLDELKLRARRAGFHNVRRFVYDSQAAPELTREIKNSGGFHRVLVDAPCTASGTLRRNPDVRFRIMPDDPEKFAATQRGILNAVKGQIRPKGKLIYATCSVFRTENEDVVEKFLAENPQFELERSRVNGSPGLDSDTMFFAVLSRT